jgi:hypothetical protein
MGEGRSVYRVLDEGRDHWEDLGEGGRITLRWTLGRQRMMGQAVFGWFRIGSSGGIF